MRTSRGGRKPLIPLDGVGRNVLDVVLIVVGAFITALAFNLFLLPNQVASGGVSGLSIIIKEWFGIEPAFTQWIFNIPLFIAGVFFLGRHYGARTLLGTICLPLLIYLTRDWPIPTANPLLGSLYGGIGVGLGLGIVFRGRGSTGGLSIVAHLLQKFTGLGLSLCVMLVDGTVIVLAGFTLSLENALYALIGLYVTGKVIDAVEMGLGYTKVAYIISDKREEMTEVILKDLDRGLTELSARGGYTGESRPVLMVVIGQSETSRLKTLVRSVDPDAFVVISNAQEVLGKGFKIQM
ncbi:YitT family protein [Saccharibacillus kuerlensis]|uniref:Membrane protein n=1 Tax=Saccharibacillus kuerlensis TaxID=459527 RepID=A0ABQ2KTR0_9BACL|nr:YitT family protein [Saccharibacillus kuerlensis]GGN93141.1 membrane protein [Saccharibacillus kuerlensis]